MSKKFTSLALQFTMHTRKNETNNTHDRSSNNDGRSDGIKPYMKRQQKLCAYNAIQEKFMKKIKKH